MSLEFEMKAILPYCDSKKYFTVYMYNSQKSLVVPVILDVLSCEKIIQAKINEPFARPSMYCVSKDILGHLKCQLVRVLVYDYADEVFFTRLELSHKGSSLETEIRFSDGLAMAIKFGVSVCMKAGVVDRVGLHLTKDMLLSEV